VPEYQQTVTPRPFEPPPVTIRPARRTSPLGRFLIWIARPAWAWRLELTIAAGLLLVWSVLAVHLGRLLGSLTFVSLAAGSVLLPPAWADRIRWALHRSSVRRRFGLAVRHAGLATHNDRVPRVLRMEATPAGDLLTVKVPAGATVEELAGRREAVAAYLEVRDVRVLRDPENARLAEVAIMRSRCRGRTPEPPGCRCGTRSRSGSTKPASTSTPGSPSATCSPEASREAASRSPTRCWWRRPRSIPTCG
jgi:hypothetical protein